MDYTTIVNKYNNQIAIFKRNTYKINIDIAPIRNHLDIIIKLSDVLELSAEFRIKTKVMEIVDIKIVQCNRNHGYGSFAMSVLFELGKVLEASEFFGTLSPIDLNDPADPSHKERIKHFYEKHGFTVDLKKRYISKTIIHQVASSTIS